MKNNKKEELIKELKLKNNINDKNSNNKMEDIDKDIDQYKSQEKIIHLEPGGKICKKKCSILFICLILYLLSLIGVFGNKFLWTFLITIPSFLGFLYELLFFIFCNEGFHTVSPNNAIVFEYYGRYIGTLKDNGYWYGYPRATTRKISLRSIQYNGNRLKVNERDGNPVELGIIVLWKIGDTAKAVFDVVNYNQFIEAQSEAAIRYIGCKYPYDPVVPGEISLRGGHEIINKELREELERRIKPSGIVIEDARVTEISYGPEVAKMMLQKQASSAQATAKENIVKGATNAVINSINQFEKNGCKFTDEEKVKYITSMMNTLCMISDVSKIINND